MKLLVGGDPEIFLKDTKKGMHVSAHDLVPGTKEKPHPVKKGAVQHDGLALEINIDPASSASEFAENLETVLQEARQILPSHVQMDFSPVVYFDKSYFDSLPAEVKTLGCSPDFSGENGQRNRMPNRISLGPSACTGAGHLCLGWGKDMNTFDLDHFWDCQQMALRLDDYFFMYNKLWDNDDKRSLMYGRQAAFRPKPFGVEYRALSNAWLKYPKLWPWLFDSCKFVFDHAVEGKKVNRIYIRQYRGPIEQIFSTTIIGFNTKGQYVQKYTIPGDRRITLLNPQVKTGFGVQDIPELPKDFVPVEFPAEEVVQRYNDFYSASFRETANRPVPGTGMGGF
jgi:hypothetical protein